MAKRKRNRQRTRSNDPLEPLRRIQASLADRVDAVCLAARTGGDYDVLAICGKDAGKRRHTISKRAYLTQIAEDGLVLSTLPIDVSHIAHHTISNSRQAKKRLPTITHLPPKPTSIDDASTWHFACQQHDDKFKPIDLGIQFPTSHKYMRIGTEQLTGADERFEEALFLMAYRSILSSLSILRGARKALITLRQERGNHRQIKKVSIEVQMSHDKLMEYKSQYDGRFVGARRYDMTHHLIAVSPHTKLAISSVDDYATTNILPDEGVTRIVVSHATNEALERQQAIEMRITDLAKGLSAREDRRPLIGLVANTFDAYIAPADYESWSDKDKRSLEKAAADRIKQFLWNQTS